MVEAVIKDEGFEVKQSTVVFVVLSIVTLGFYYYYWLLSTTRRINAVIEKRLISDVPVIVFCALLMASTGITDVIFEMCVSMRTSYTTYYMLVTIFSLALLVFGIVISIKLATSLKALFTQNSENIKVATWAVVIFQGYYLYYLIRNRKELSMKANDVMPVADSTPQTVSPYEELEKLAKLKADGIISEEEFEQQKKKILDS